jgi:hypothetical protein
MSVAWPQKTAKGLGPPGSPESADPYTGFGKRRARVPAVAAAGSCKTPMRGFPGLPALGRRHTCPAGAGRAALRSGAEEQIAPSPLGNARQHQATTARNQPASRTDPRSSIPKPATGDRLLRLRTALYGRRPRDGGASIPHHNLATGAADEPPALAHEARPQGGLGGSASRRSLVHSPAMAASEAALNSFR